MKPRIIPLFMAAFAAFFIAVFPAQAHRLGGQISAKTDYVGINLSALENGSAVPGTVGSDYPLPTTTEWDFFRTKNFQRVRLPFKWERLQPTLSGALDATYLGYLDTAASNAATRGMCISLDVHNFGQYRNSKIGAGTVTAANFADLWSRLASHFNGVAGICGYDLMNEPNSMPSPTAWQDAAQAAVTAIRLADTTTPIYVEGNGFSSAYQWLANGNDSLKSIIGTGLIFSAHNYADYNNSGTYPTFATSSQGNPSNKTCSPSATSYQCAQTMGDQLDGGATLDTNILVKRATPFVSWCVQNHLTCDIGESGVSNDDANWLTTLDNELAYLALNGIKITYWNAGPFFASYPLGVEPQTSGGDTVQVGVLTKYTNAYQPTTYYLTGPVRGTASAASTNFTVQYKGYLKSSVTITPNDNDPNSGTSAGGTFTPSSVTLAAGFNPSATFTYTAPGTDAYQIAVTSNAAAAHAGLWADPAPHGFATVSDMFSSLSVQPQNIFSVRKIYAPYDGPAVTLRRASDNATKSFNFASIHLNASVDCTAINTWAGASNVYLVTQYDQSPNGWNRGPKASADGFNDTTPANADQPQFICSGTNPDSRPEILWSSNGMDAKSPVAGKTAITVASVSKPASLGESRQVGWDKVQNYDFPNVGFIGGYTQTDPNGSTYTETLANSIDDNTAWHTNAWRYQLGVAKGMSAFRDGILVQQGDTNLHSPAATGIKYDFRSTAYFGYFIFSGSTHWNGRTTETIIWASAPTDTELAAIDANEASYFGTTTATAPVIPTPPSIDSTTPSAFPLTGVNTSEMEFPNGIPGALHVNYFDHSATDGPFYHSISLTTIREPIKWERLQPTLSGAFDATYLGEVTAAVTNYQNAGENILLDIHNYSQYGPSNIGDADLETVTNNTLISGASFTASMSSVTKIMTVTAVSSGSIITGEKITCAGCGTSVTINAYGTGSTTGTGGTGTYSINNSVTVSSEAMSQTDTFWTKDANTTLSASGGATITGDTGTALSQTPGLSNGLVYTLTYTMTDAAGTITPNIGGAAGRTGGGNGTTRSASGTYSEVIRVGQTNDTLSFNTVGFTGTISNVSLKFVAATQADYADLMTRLALAFPSASYPKLNIDMMNEPHGIDATVMANAYQAGITAARAAGFTGYFLIEGTSFASCLNWDSSGWSAAASGITDMTAGGTPIAAGAAGYKVIDECHQYFDSDASGSHSTCTKTGATALVTFTNWANANSRVGLIGEFGISTDPNCLSQYKDMLDYMVTNNNVWKGFTAWTDGAYALDYMYNTAPASKTSTPTVNMPNTNLLISHRTLQ